MRGLMLDGGESMGTGRWEIEQVPPGSHLYRAETMGHVDHVATGKQQVKKERPKALCTHLLFDTARQRQDKGEILAAVNLFIQWIKFIFKNILCIYVSQCPECPFCLPILCFSSVFVSNFNLSHFTHVEASGLFALFRCWRPWRCCTGRWKMSPEAWW